MYTALIFFHNQREPRTVTRKSLRDLRDQILAEALRNHKQPLRRYWRLLEVPQGVPLEEAYRNLYNQFRILQGLIPSQKWMHPSTQEEAYSYGLIGHFKAYQDTQNGIWEPLRPWAPAVKRILNIALTENLQ